MLADISIQEAKRIALHAQGLNTPRPEGSVGIDQLNSVVEQIGLVQLDSVNAVVRSHYMPFYSRLGPYELGLVEEMAFERRQQFEYWAHAASLLPIDMHPLFRYRMRSALPGTRVTRLMDRRPGYLKAILDEVTERGSISVSDLTDPGKRTGPWWGYNDGKIALEWHFLNGIITTSKRSNFTRFYDLTERVIPRRVLRAPNVSEEDAHRKLLTVAARCHGVGTAKDLADYFRIPPYVAENYLNDLVEGKLLGRIKVENWREPAYIHPDVDLPAEAHGCALLSPFDSLVWERSRIQRLFGFKYRIEIYVPERMRQYGYYVMPFLMGDNLVARVDLKADRGSGRLLVRGAFLEQSFDSGLVAAELASELHLMACWLGLGKVVVGRRGNLADQLRIMLKK